MVAYNELRGRYLLYSMPGIDSRLGEGLLRDGNTSMGAHSALVINGDGHSEVLQKRKRGRAIDKPVWRLPSVDLGETISRYDQYCHDYEQLYSSNSQILGVVACDAGIADKVEAALGPNKVEHIDLTQHPQFVEALRKGGIGANGRTPEEKLKRAWGIGY